MILKNKFNIVIYRNLNLLSQGLNKIIINKVKNKESNFIISSGKSLKQFFKEINLNTPGLRDVRFFLSDERIVYSNSKFSNKRKLCELLGLKINEYDKIIGLNDDLIRKTPKNLIKDVEKDFKKIQSFKTVILSIAHDGHYASIFQKSNIIKQSKNFIICKNREENFDRISLNTKLLSKLDSIILIIAGRNKAKLIDLLINEKNNEQYPFIKLIKNSKNKVMILTHEQCYNKAIR